MNRPGSEAMNRPGSESMRELGKRGGKASAAARAKRTDYRDELRYQVSKNAPGFVSRLLSTGAGAVKVAELLERIERDEESRALREAGDVDRSAPFSEFAALYVKSGALTDDAVTAIVAAIPEAQLVRALRSLGHEVEA
jgi:hypothetical protein